MTYICLIDCNNFYASCETLFSPQFRKKPLVVVSGKNGIVIARSKEAKALNIPMGAVSFMYKSLFVKEDVIVRETNFPLYKDISNRIKETVATFCFPTFIYSIDEMFLQIPKENFSIKVLEEIQKKIKTWVGIDVSIGLSLTKTLAKVATKVAKKTPTNRHVLIDEKEITDTLKSFPVENLWGIGRQYFKKLSLYHVKTAYELISLNDAFTKKILSVCGTRIVNELKGTNSYPFIQKETEKSLQITKTFQHEIVSVDNIKKIIATFIADGCEKLRKIKRQSCYFIIFLESSRYKGNYQKFIKTFCLEEPSFYTPDFLSLKEEAFSGLTDGDIIVKRAGIAFFQLTETSSFQNSLFPHPSIKNPKLMACVDSINSKYGKKTLRFGSQSFTFSKHMPSSPKYTTCWNDILTISIS